MAGKILVLDDEYCDMLRTKIVGSGPMPRFALEL
jgi:hypothetical protein